MLVINIKGMDFQNEYMWFRKPLSLSWQWMGEEGRQIHTVLTALIRVEGMPSSAWKNQENMALSGP